MRVLLPRLLLLLVSFGIAACFAEVALRLQIGPPVRYVYPQESYIHDPEMGHRLTPGERAYTHDQPISINDHGLRGPDVPGAVPPGTRRLIALGDSQTFGNGLPQDETWPALLEVRLADVMPESHWQILNGGISGTDTWQHAHQLERIAAEYEFDGVVLAFYVNDVTPRYSPPDHRDITNSWSKRVGYILKRSALFTLAWQSWKRATSDASAGDVEAHTLSGTEDRVVEAGWKQVETSLAEMKKLCDERGVALRVVVLPRLDQITGEEPSVAYNERIASIADRLGLHVIDVLVALQLAWQDVGYELFIPWDGHNTGVANGVIAAAIAIDFERGESP